MTAHSLGRKELVARLARLLSGHPAAHTVRVAVDGPDAAGKTTLADELAVALRQAGRPALRVGFDDFHRPRQERYRRGPLSAEGYFRDCFDFSALRALVLQPLGPGGDGRFQPAPRDLRTETLYEQPAQVAPARSVLVVDGVFLLTDELRDCWDLSLFLDVSPAETLRRALTRDTALFGSPAVVRERYEHRYLPGQQLYRTAAEPTRVADVVLDNDDPDAPVIRKWPTKPTGGVSDAGGWTGPPDPHRPHRDGDGPTCARSRTRSPTPRRRARRSTLDNVHGHNS